MPATMTIVRLHSSITVTVPSGADGLSAANQFAFYQFNSGIFIVPSALDATTKIAFKVSNDATDFVELRNKENVLIEMTVEAGCAYPLPDELKGANFVKIWCENSGVLVPQSSQRNFKLSLKS